MDPNSGFVDVILLCYTMLVWYMLSSCVRLSVTSLEFY